MSEDLKIIIKCLNMLSSNQDGEVLNAAKLAVKLLKKNNSSWENFFANYETLNAKIHKLQKELVSMQATAGVYKYRWTETVREYEKLKNKPYWKKVLGQ